MRCHRGQGKHVFNSWVKEGISLGATNHIITLQEFYKASVTKLPVQFVVAVVIVVVILTCYTYVWVTNGIFLWAVHRVKYTWKENFQQKGWGETSCILKNKSR